MRDYFAQRCREHLVQLVSCPSVHTGCITKDKLLFPTFPPLSNRYQFSAHLGFFQRERKNKTCFNCLVICPVDGFFILFTHILQSQCVNTANQHSYQLPLCSHQQADTLGLGNLVYAFIFLLKLTSFYQTIMKLMFQI